MVPSSDQGNNDLAHQIQDILPIQVTPAQDTTDNKEEPNKRMNSGSHQEALNSSELQCKGSSKGLNNQVQELCPYQGTINEQERGYLKNKSFAPVMYEHSIYQPSADRPYNNIRSPVRLFHVLSLVHFGIVFLYKNMQREENPNTKLVLGIILKTLIRLENGLCALTVLILNDKIQEFRIDENYNEVQDLLVGWTIFQVVLSSVMGKAQILLISVLEKNRKNVLIGIAPPPYNELL